MEEIEDGLIVNLLASLVISLLISIEQQIPAHKRKARAVIAVEDSIRALASLNSLTMTPELINVGVTIWNRCIEELQVQLEEAIYEYHQYELFYIQDNEIFYTTYRKEITNG